MIRLFRKVRQKDAVIDAIKARHHNDVDKDIIRIKKINKVLSNGVTLKVYQATGHKNDR